jgi:hypothetical protein
MAQRLFIQWLEQNKDNRELRREVGRMFTARSAVADSIGSTARLEDWLAKPSSDTPDIFVSVAAYGRSRLITKGWKELPIKVAEAEREEWRKEILSVTVDELRAYQLSAAGEFLAVAGKNPSAVGELLVQGVNERVTKMQEAADRPQSFYQPRQWDPNSEVDQEDLVDGDYTYEFNKFDLPFALREELECFAYGMEHLRIMCYDDEQELGLPNRALFDALMLVDLNQLHATLNAIDPKLKEILKHLARIKYNTDPLVIDYADRPAGDFLLDNAEAPDGFWWRHWYKEAAERRQGRRDTRS